jgi:serine O-acetyltransferase
MDKKFSKEISGIVSTVVSSYKQYLDTASRESEYLPNRDDVEEVIHTLQELLFPGYFGKQIYTGGTVVYHIGELLVSVYERLHKQITLALTHNAAKKNINMSDVEEKAEEISRTFLSRIPEIREVLATDVKAAFDGDPAAEDVDEIIFSYPGIFAISVYRLAHELYLLSVPLIPRIMTEYAHGKTGIDIHAGASIGRYFFIDHGTGVVIGETTNIGSNVKIYQGVTLGALSTRGGQSFRGVKRHPTLEDNVTVYSGASILGGETVIGEGVVIGSNAFITKSVPERTKVSVKNPELVFKGQAPKEFEQEFIPDWVIKK